MSSNGHANLLERVLGSDISANEGIRASANGGTDASANDRQMVAQMHRQTKRGERESDKRRGGNDKTVASA